MLHRETFFFDHHTTLRWFKEISYAKKKKIVMSNKKKHLTIKKFHNENGVIKIDFINYLPESAISLTLTPSTQHSFGLAPSTSMEGSRENHSSVL